MRPFSTFIDCDTECCDWQCAPACVIEAGGTIRRPVQSVPTETGFRSDNQIESAIITSLLTWKRDDDQYADKINPRTPNGWWADVNSPFGEIGSRLYKLPYMPRDNSTLAFAKTETEQALSWMVPTYVDRVDATASYRTGGRVMDIQVNIDRESYIASLQTHGCLSLISLSCKTRCK